MPEKNIDLISAVGIALTLAISFFASILSRENKKLTEIKEELDQVDANVHNVEKDLHEFREHVALKYPSHAAMQACSENISKSITDGLKTQAAELKLAMQQVIQHHRHHDSDDCSTCEHKKNAHRHKT